MKRIISIVLVLQMMMSFMTFAQKETEFLFAENFDGYATNTIVSFVDGADGTRIVEYKSRDKGLFISGDKQGAVISHAVAPVSDFVVHMDVKIDRLYKADFFTMIDGDGVETNFFSYDAENGFTLHDGKNVNPVEDGTGVVKLKMLVNLKLQKFSLYLNSRTFVKNVKFSNNKISGCAELKTVFYGEQGKNAEVTVDNIYIYQGTGIIANLPRSSYNAASYDYTESEKEEKGFRIYANETFDNRENFAELGYYAAIYGSAEIVREDNGNRYLSVTNGSFRYDWIRDMDDDYVVAEADINYISNPVKAATLMFGNHYQLFDLLKRDSSGNILDYNGRILIEKVPTGRFYTYSLIINQRNWTADFYFEGQLIATGLELRKDTGSNYIRQIGFSPLNITVCYDNLKIYTGDKIVDITGMNPPDELIFQDNDAALKILEDCAAFNTYSGYAYAKEEKIKLSEVPYFEDGECWLSQEFTQKAFDKVVDNDSKIDGKAVNCKVKDGKYYVSVKDFCEKILNINYFTDETYNFVIMGNKSFERFYDETIPENEPNITEGSTGQANFMLYTLGQFQYEDANMYLMFERPNAVQIMEDFKNKGAGEHPRLLLDKEGWENLRQEIKTDPIRAKYAQIEIGRAENALNFTPFEYEPSSSGGIKATSNSVDPLRFLAVGYQLTGDGRYAEKAYEIMQIMATWPDWYPFHYLDSGVAMTGTALAYDLCYDYWNDEQREFVKKLIYTYGLSVVKQQSSEHIARSWPSGGGNWTGVTRCGVVLASVALMDDYPELCSKLISQSIRHLERTMSWFAPDGIFRESIGYWQYFWRYMTLLDATLISALGSDYGVMDAPGTEKTVVALLAQDGAVGGFNYHDAGSGGATGSGHVMCFPMSYIGYRYGDKSIAELRKRFMAATQDSSTLWDLLWLDTSDTTEALDVSKLDMYFRGNNTGMMRKGWFESDTAYLGYHFSPNVAGHGHMDSGVWIFDQLGYRWVCELGSDEYSLPKYGNKEDSMVYRTRTEGHNCYVINPSSHAGQKRLTDDYLIKSETAAKGAYAIADLTSAYRDWVSSAQRGWMLTDDRQSAIVRDELELLQENSEFYWFMHTPADVQIEGNTAILTQGGAQMKFEFISNQPLTLSVMDAVPLPTSPIVNNADNTGVRKLVLSGIVSGKLTVTAKLTPVIEHYALTEIEDVPLNEWTLPEGEILGMPAFDMISVDGLDIPTYSEYSSSYTVLREKSDKEPVIEGRGENLTTEIEKMNDGSYKIKAVDVNDSRRFKYYYITVKDIDIAAFPKEAEGSRFIMPLKLTASETAQTAHPIEHIFDGDYSTSFTANGAAEVVFELDKVYNIAGLGAAFTNGFKRKEYFEIYTSIDGINYTKFADCNSSATTSEAEWYSLGNTEAKFVKVVAGGSSEGLWWNCSEMYVFGR